MKLKTYRVYYSPHLSPSGQLIGHGGHTGHDVHASQYTDVVAGFESAARDAVERSTARMVSHAELIAQPNQVHA